MSYHLTASEVTNQLLYMNFPNLECKICQKDLTSTLPSSVALCFRNLGNLYEDFSSQSTILLHSRSHFPKRESL